MERYCNKCGKLLGENATFCRYCGASVAGDVNVKRDKNSDENSHGANRKDSDTNMTADTNKNSDISSPRKEADIPIAPSLYSKATRWIIPYWL